ncbi:hypothetical protein GE09DRAFT_1077788 [Coniochaeta sp. 2T2.1]|nr:hypothetical protein GE09DRAFT_1077788 [Coniochaeta sp. 2T2.1]
MCPNVDMHWVVLFLQSLARLHVCLARRLDSERDLATMIGKTSLDSPCNLSTAYVAVWRLGQEERKTGNEAQGDTQAKEMRYNSHSSMQHATGYHWTPKNSTVFCPF